jgi:hypothetical protein
MWYREATDYDVVGLMRLACSIFQATDISSVYVIPIAVDGKLGNMKATQCYVKLTYIACVVPDC